MIEKLGYGQFGEVRSTPQFLITYIKLYYNFQSFLQVKLCEVIGKSDLLNSQCKIVAVKELRAGASESTRNDFKQEVKVLAKIRDPNIVRVLGACLDDDPVFVVVEYTEFGDLNQYLQDHIAETTTPLPTNAKTLRQVILKMLHKIH